MEQIQWKKSKDLYIDQDGVIYHREDLSNIAYKLLTTEKKSEVLTNKKQNYDGNKKSIRTWNEHRIIVKAEQQHIYFEV